MVCIEKFTSRLHKYTMKSYISKIMESRIPQSKFRMWQSQLKYKFIGFGFYTSYPSDSDLSNNHS